MTVKFVVNFAFQLVFEQTRTAFFHGAGVCQGADFASAAHHVQLFFRFEQAHLMHHRTPVRQRGRRGQILTRAFAQLIQSGENNLIGVRIFALRVIKHVEAVEQLIELLIDFAKRQRAVDAQLLRCGLLP